MSPPAHVLASRDTVRGRTMLVSLEYLKGRGVPVAFAHPAEDQPSSLVVGRGPYSSTLDSGGTMIVLRAESFGPRRATLWRIFYVHYQRSKLRRNSAR